MRKLFGTDGVRGVANQYPMTTEVAMGLGRAIAYTSKNGHKRHKIVIGKDTRLSCYMLEHALASGICSMGVDVLLLGPMPTPAIAFITKAMRADAGVMISASHNQFQDNGIKFFDSNGFKLPDDTELKLEQLFFSNGIDSLCPTAEEVGRIKRIEEAHGRYIEFLKQTIPAKFTLEGLKVVVDCAHGASYHVAPTVLEELGAEVIPINISPNGMNINRACGALHPEVISQWVVSHKADVGIALDGDADRVIFCDANGKVIEGDAILALCAVELSEEKRLFKDTVVATIMSNLGLEEALKPHGIKVERVQVGDRYVVGAMMEKGCNFGGENSGHIIFLDRSTTGDGMIAALHVLSMMKQKGKPLSELASIYSAFPQKLLNVRVKEKRDLDTVPAVSEMMRSIEGALADSGRLLVRYSGTEPLVRVMVEGKDPVAIDKMAKEMASCIEQHLG